MVYTVIPLVNQSLSSEITVVFSVIPLVYQRFSSSSRECKSHFPYLNVNLVDKKKTCVIFHPMEYWHIAETRTSVKSA